ncbi:MAG: type II toxin-antitoxin system HipA family toxin [Ilumatobacteraceae bacterium]
MADLYVIINGQIAAEVTRTNSREAELEYRPQWEGVPLSTSLPATRRRHSAAAVTPYLWGLLPDNDNVIQRWAREARVSATDIVGLLAAVGEDVAGAAQYVPAGAENEASQPGTIEYLSKREVAELVGAVAADTNVWHRAPTGKHVGRWSLAGAQGKLALAFDARKGWGIPHGAAPTTHIIKPATDGLDDHDLNEHLCLAAANKLGIRAAESVVKEFDGVRALVVSRYDRTTEPPIRRIHQEDMCQALGLHPSKKYESDGGPSAGDIARHLGEVSSNPDADRRRFAEALLFNWLIIGTDAHAKNYSLLLSGTSARLAPLYDIASVLPYGEHPKKCRLAMKIAGSYKPTDLGATHWRRAAGEIGVDSDWIVERGAQFCFELPDALSEAATATGLDAAGKIVATMMDWIRQCAVRLGS